MLNSDGASDLFKPHKFLGRRWMNVCEGARRTDCCWSIKVRVRCLEMTVLSDQQTRVETPWSYSSKVLESLTTGKNRAANQAYLSGDVVGGGRNVTGRALSHTHHRSSAAQHTPAGRRERSTRGVITARSQTRKPPRASSPPTPPTYEGKHITADHQGSFCPCYRFCLIGFLFFLSFSQLFFKSLEPGASLKLQIQQLGFTFTPRQPVSNAPVSQTVVMTRSSVSHQNSRHKRL